MKLNVTLKATTGISSGFIMVVIFTRDLSPGDLKTPFDINNISDAPNTIVFTQAVPAPISSNTPITTPTMPAATYYGLVIGASVLGTLAKKDFTPMTAELLNTVAGVAADSSACGSNAPYTMTFP
jgi:hypothetical protein